jgi:D-proline reductase (dithiol) PrdB
VARLEDLSLAHRLYVKRYRFERYVEDVPAPSMTRSLGDATVALVTTGGLHTAEQEPFDGKLRGGDSSYRLLHDDVDGANLRCAHRSDAFDHAGIEADPELAFPLTALHGLVAQGMIGRASGVHASFMGSITKPEALIERTAPEVAAHFAAADVDVAVLVPL